MLPRTKNISIHTSNSDLYNPITSILFSEIFDTFCFDEALSIANFLSLNSAAFSKSNFSDASCICLSNSFKILSVFPSSKSIISSICFLYSSGVTYPIHGAKHLFI